MLQFQHATLHAGKQYGRKNQNYNLNTTFGYNLSQIYMCCGFNLPGIALQSIEIA